MAERDFTLLDGGLGRELQRRGLIEPKTVWSATALLEHPAAVREIHREFIAAGAEVITTNTYGVVPNLLAQEDMGEKLEELLDIALRLAGEARKGSGRAVRIAGSLPPLDISYRPELIGPEPEIEAAYRRLAQRLAPGVDLLLCETMSSAVEARAAAKGALSTGKPVWVAWTLAEEADGCLRSGENVAEAFTALESLPVAAFLFNCCAPEAISRALPDLRRLTGKPIGAYANAFRPLPKDYVMGEAASEDGGHPLRDDMDVPRYLEAAKSWRQAGAEIIGGCCGIGPEYIAALSQALH